MSANPFTHPPSRRLSGHALWVGLVGLVLGIPVQGMVATFDPTFAAPSGSSPVGISLAHQRHAWDRWNGVPVYCSSGAAVNELQKKRCGEYWESLIRTVLLVAIPLGIGWLSWLMALDRLRLFYRRARKKVDLGGPSTYGTVTHPALAPGDFFSWLFCLKVVALELETTLQVKQTDKAGPQKRQIRVYIPDEGVVPLPGQRMSVFDAGVFLGQRRSVAVLYAPHMSVLHGSRK